jgi:glycosyltransferase involved in cell wall biosynthesis
MRVLIIGWADISKQGTQGGGYNIVVGALSKELIAKGEEVFYINSGQDYNLLQSISLEDKEEFEGIKCHSIVNSRIPVPAVKYFNQFFDKENLEENKLIINFIKRNKIEVLHVQSLEGFSFSLIREVRKTFPKIKIIITPHDAFYFCPRVHFLYEYKEICNKNTCGIKCEECLNIQNVDQRFKAKVWLKVILKSLLSDSIKNVIINHKKTKNCSQEFKIGQYQNSSDTFSNALNEQNSKSDIFRRYRSEVIKLIESVDRVQCLSEFHQSLFYDLGVSKDKVSLHRLGLPHLDKIRENGSHLKESKKIRIGFHGAESPTKGTNFLLECLSKWPKEIHEQCEFYFLLGSLSNENRAIVNRLKNCKVKIGFSHNDLVDEVRNYDVAIFPSLVVENSPISLLEDLHAGVPCLVSSIGGAPELVSGLKVHHTFEPGNNNDITKKLLVMIEEYKEVKNSSAFREQNKDELLKNKKIVPFQEFLDKTMKLYLRD